MVYEVERQHGDEVEMDVTELPNVDTGRCC